MFPIDIFSDYLFLLEVTVLFVKSKNSFANAVKLIVKISDEIGSVEQL